MFYSVMIHFIQDKKILHICCVCTLFIISIYYHPLFVLLLLIYVQLRIYNMDIWLLYSYTCLKNISFFQDVILSPLPLIRNTMNVESSSKALLLYNYCLYYCNPIVYFHFTTGISFYFYYCY